MKTLFATALLITSLSANSGDVPIENSRLSLEGSDVSLNFRLAGATPQDVKILFCDGILDEDAMIQHALEWTLGLTTGKTTVTKMIQSGYNLKQVVSTGNAKQYYLVFTK